MLSRLQPWRRGDLARNGSSAKYVSYTMVGCEAHRVETRSTWTIRWRRWWWRRWWWWRRHVFRRWRRVARRHCRLLLLLRRVLVVLAVQHVVLVSTVSGIRILTARGVVLRVLCAVVRCTWWTCVAWRARTANNTCPCSRWTHDGRRRSRAVRLARPAASIPAASIPAILIITTTSVAAKVMTMVTTTTGATATVMAMVVRVVTISSSVSPSSPSVVGRRSRILLEMFVLLLHIRNEVFAQLFGALDFAGIRSTMHDMLLATNAIPSPTAAPVDLRHVQKHRVIALLLRGILVVGGAASLDLNATTGLLLDMLDVGATMADHLRAHVEPRKRLKADWDSLLGPFALTYTSQRNKTDAHALD